jgi:hypothetical protein
MAAVTTNAVLGDGGAKAKPVFSTSRVSQPAAAPKPAPVKPKAVARPKGR